VLLLVRYIKHIRFNVRFFERFFTLCSSDVELADWLRLATRMTCDCTVKDCVLNIYQLQPNGDVLPTEYRILPTEYRMCYRQST
jgi:hypothetical protein